MTDAELELIKERVNNAEQAKRRVLQLQQAVRIMEDNLIGIDIRFKDDSADVYYATELDRERKPRWCKVCWADEEEIGKSVVAALKRIVNERLEIAVGTFNDT